MPNSVCDLYNFLVIIKIMKNLLAQGYNPIPGGLNVPPSGSALTLSRAEDLLRVLGNYLITFSIIFAVIFIVISGIRYMSGSPDDARKSLNNAIIGSAIVLGVGLILKTIASLITGQFFGQCFLIFCINP